MLSSFFKAQISVFVPVFLSLPFQFFAKPSTFFTSYQKVQKIKIYHSLTHFKSLLCLVLNFSSYIQPRYIVRKVLFNPASPVPITKYGPRAARQADQLLQSSNLYIYLSDLHPLPDFFRFFSFNSQETIFWHQFDQHKLEQVTMLTNLRIQHT